MARKLKPCTSTTGISDHSVARPSIWTGLSGHRLSTLSRPRKAKADGAAINTMIEASAGIRFILLVGATFASGHHTIEAFFHFDLQAIKTGLLFGREQFANVFLRLAADIFDLFSILSEDLVELLAVALESRL